MTADVGELVTAARQAAQAGAEVAARWQRRRDDLQVAEKAASDDLVSQADTETEQAVRDVLARLRPDDAVLGEEAGLSRGSTGVRWLVDPIDGTTSYLYGRDDWAVSVAAADGTGRLLAAVVAEPGRGRVTEAGLGLGTRAEGGEVPRLEQHDLSRALVELNLGTPAQRPRSGRVLDVLVPQVRDVRRGGSAAAALAHVATGRADAAWLPGLQPWDCAAGILLVTEAGGVVGDLDGPSAGGVPPTGDVLAASPALWLRLRDLLAPAWSAG